jgi:hypothetical protein
MRVVVLAAFAACGGSSNDLTCQQLADPNNCWAKAAAEATSCIAMRTQPGLFSADRTTCEWSDGTMVTFDAPLPTQTSALDHLSFDVTGPACSWSFTDTFHNHMELTVGDKTETASLSNGTFTLACDDGTDYSTAFNNLFKCLPTPAPTDGFELSSTMVSFTISAVNAPTPLFTCMTPTP